MNERYYVTMEEEKKAWGEGPWLFECDKVQWKDEATGLPCLAKRNRMGAWCGYVGVSEGHPAFERHYNEVDVDVHGGLTYADHCQDGPEEHAICHIPDPGEPDHVWWLGFDTAHTFDLVPAMTAYAYEQQFGSASELAKLKKKHESEADDDWKDTYRDLDYVRAEAASLAQQLAAMV